MIASVVMVMCQILSTGARVVRLMCVCLWEHGEARRYLFCKGFWVTVCFVVNVYTHESDVKQNLKVLQRLRVTHWMSQHSHTVEKWPHPNFLITWYLPLNKSPIFTGWYPPEREDECYRWLQVMTWNPLVGAAERKVKQKTSQNSKQSFKSENRIKDRKILKFLEVSCEISPCSYIGWSNTAEQWQM